MSYNIDIKNHIVINDDMGTVIDASIVMMDGKKVLFVSPANKSPGVFCILNENNETIN